MRFISCSEEETLRLGEAIGRLSKGKEVICLVGEMGSGKTTLVKGIARGMGIHRSYQVRSPTFTVVNEYLTDKGKLIHVDLYRVGQMELYELVGTGLVVIEWGRNLDICECTIEVEILDEKRRSFTLEDGCLTFLHLVHRQVLGSPDSFS